VKHPTLFPQAEAKQTCRMNEVTRQFSLWRVNDPSRETCEGEGRVCQNLSARVNNCTEAAYYSAYRTSSELNTTPTNRAVGVNFCCYFTL